MPLPLEVALSFTGDMEYPITIVPSPNLVSIFLGNTVE
jgi:hypothetical protein